jgi:pyrroloquinoline-quinone synthase
MTTKRPLPSGEAPSRVDLDAMRGLVDDHPVVRHRFLERFRQGGWSKSQVRRWAGQQFYFSLSLPSAFAALHARIPDRLWQRKRRLVHLLALETFGSEEPDAHSHHFVELCAFLEIDVAELARRDPQPYTAAYVQLRLEICLDQARPIHVGLAAIAFGNEFLNVHIYRAYRGGIHLIPGCERAPIGYFDAHLKDEESDARVFTDLLAELVTGPEDLRAARAGVLELLDARVKFFEALYQDLASDD